MTDKQQSDVLAQREQRNGIYIASKTRHAGRWKDLRAKGFPIISTWIDEAREGESADLDDLWSRCIAEASGCRVLIVYREQDDILKGGWVEVGAALAAGVPVYAVGLDGFTIAEHKRVKHFPTIEDAFSAASWDCVTPQPLTSAHAEGWPSNRDEIAKIIDPLAFRPQHVNGPFESETEKEKWLRARNVAYYKADQIGSCPSPAEMGRQPIETAPKDGTHILAWRDPIGIRFTNNTNPPTVVHWFNDPDEPGFYTSVNEQAPEHPFNPTHWMPLPDVSGRSQPENSDRFAAALHLLGMALGCQALPSKIQNDINAFLSQIASPKSDALTEAVNEQLSYAGDPPISAAERKLIFGTD
jgi:hypothetical protein